jgi:hypothetical protein
MSCSSRRSEPVAHPDCPQSPRKVWFAGEAVCRTLNDYTHSALESGRATTLKVLYHLGLAPKPHRSICATVIPCR